MFRPVSILTIISKYKEIGHSSSFTPPLALQRNQNGKGGLEGGGEGGGKMKRKEGKKSGLGGREMEWRES